MACPKALPDQDSSTQRLGQPIPHLPWCDDFSYTGRRRRRQPLTTTPPMTTTKIMTRTMTPTELVTEVDGVSGDLLVTGTVDVGAKTNKRAKSLSNLKISILQHLLSHATHGFHILLTHYGTTILPDPGSTEMNRGCAMSLPSSYYY